MAVTGLEIWELGISYGEISVLMGQGDEDARRPKPPDLSAHLPRSLFEGDFNSDGKAHLAWTNATTTRVGVLLGNGGGCLDVLMGDSLLTGHGNDAGAFPAGGSDVTVGDYNGAGCGTWRGRTPWTTRSGSRSTAASGTGRHHDCPRRCGSTT